ncbi:MAG: hypothetical protein HFI31_07760 [Lachnospiraceae bacterium]|jgi:hypothetical protein|nr:hypothetical protein [Lachnospiraceae bacterium]MCI9134066.1 hypothetical protein [Lachnospiraceae bacterium]
MQQLIKITSVPMQTVRLTQGGRLVNSDSVDIERRKALARQMSFQRRNTSGSSLPMDAISKINRTFSKKNVSSSAPIQPQTVNRQQAVSQQQSISRQQAAITQSQAPAMQIPSASGTVSTGSAAAVPPAAYEAASVSSPETTQNFHSSYAAQLGALEMRVAKGDLTFLPPMVMTIVTQRPELHFEYLGDFNYVPPRNPETGGNINLFT